ncbi:MAG TPA: hypothetical protein VKI17_08675, partial [Gemmataceae bacterium]|nr:hypothetical protein [Gemmataceae bacterium]
MMLLDPPRLSPPHHAPALESSTARAKAGVARPRRSQVCNCLCVYGSALALCLAIMTWSLRLWRADISVPFSYKGDGLFTLLWIKGIIDNGWYLHNDYLGTPFGSDVHDFPMADNLNFLLLKLMTCFSANPAVVFNVYFLLTFPLAMVSTLFVLRRLGVSAFAAMATALLYTFLPYHVLRGTHGHLFLASYFLVPLAVLVALWIAGPRDLQPGQPHMNNRCLAASVVIALLLSSAGLYYAFFAAFLLICAGLMRFVQRGTFRAVGISLVLSTVIAAGAILNALPSIAYRFTYGANPAAIQRVLAGPELYGLKITQLFLPTTQHRVHAWAEIKAGYDHAAAFGRGDFWYLGVLGVAGFLILIGRLCFKHGRSAGPALLDVLAVFNIFGLLLATVGGLGATLSMFFGPWLRCYERMSIYIACFSLFAMALVVDRFSRRHRWLCRSAWARASLWGLILAAGIWDETGPHYVPFYRDLRETYTRDAQFIAAIEAGLPEGGRIFQLPYMPFPESDPVCRMGDYEHLRGYLHSKRLRWSYASIKGRDGDAWYKERANMPPAMMLSELAAAGFDGIYLDRDGYEDRGRAIEAELTR